MSITKQLRVTLASLLMLTTTQVWAVDYINPQPFYKQASGLQVKPVQSNYHYPAITWGDSILAVANKDLFPGGVKLVDDPVQQIKDVVSGKTPFVRQTAGAGTMLIDAIQKSGIKMEIFHSVTDSAGGDVVVTRKFKNLKAFVQAAKSGQKPTVAIQYGGPHMGWLIDILTKNGLSMSNVEIKYLPNLFGDNSPETAIAEDRSIDMAFVISPSAAALTEGNTSVPGVSVLVTTKVMSESIKDNIFVRSDWASANKAQLKKVRDAFLSTAQSKILNSALVSEAATLMFGSASGQNVADTEGLRDDAKFHSRAKSDSFMTSKTNQNNFPRKIARIVAEFSKAGLISNSAMTIPVTNWGVKQSQKAKVVTASKTVTAKIEKEVSQLKKSGQGQVLISEKINFEPNQSNFPESKYGNDFKAVINFANTYPGAVLNIVGHVDPSLLRAWNKAIEFKQARNAGTLAKVERYLNNIPGNSFNLSQMSVQRITIERNNVRDAAISTSKVRANAVKKAIVAYALKQNVDLDAYKLVVHGDGADSPKYSNPKSQQQVSANIRVEFNVTNYNAEINSFTEAQDF